MDVVMPDGTVVKNVPEGTTKSELLRRLGRQPPIPEPGLGATAPPAQEGPGGARAFGDAALNTFTDAFLNMPENALNLGLQVAATSPAGVLGERLGLLPEGSGQPLGDPGRVDLGVPDATDLRAGIETAGSAVGQLAGGDIPNVGETFDEQRAMLERRFEQGREEDPALAILGEATGTGLALGAGRIPIARGLQRMRAGKEIISEGRVKPDPLKDMFDKISDKGAEIARALRRAGGKVAETSLEGAVLGALQDDDPLTRAGLAAGAQAGGSLSLFLIEKPLRRLLPTIGLAAVGSLMFQAVAPGQRNAFEALDFAVDKTLIAFGAGALASAVGAGRITGVRGQNMPLLADAVTSIPRGAAQSLLAQMARADRDGDQTTLRVIQEYGTNPKFFTPEEQRVLDRTLKDGRRSVSKAVEQLMKNPEFRDRMSVLTD